MYSGKHHCTHCSMYVPHYAARVQLLSRLYPVMASDTQKPPPQKQCGIVLGFARSPAAGSRLRLKHPQDLKQPCVMEDSAHMSNKDAG